MVKKNALKEKIKKLKKSAKPARRGKASLTGEPGRTKARMLGRVPDAQWAKWKKAAKLAELNFSEWARRNLDAAAGIK